MDREPGKGARPRRGRFLRLGLGLILSLAGGLLCLEGILRWLLFSNQEWARHWGWGLRKAELYCSSESGTEYWKLHARFSGSDAVKRNRFFDPVLGWIDPQLEPGTLNHACAGLIGERRPVLLYGDSYARCATGPEDCWEGLLERSPLGQRYFLLNHGVGGYGLDQTYLLLSLTLDRYVEQDPVVVVGLLVDDDLDRCYLGLRGHPKPYFRLQDGVLVLHAIEETTPLDYVRAHPVGIRSYLWRWFLFGQRALPIADPIAWTSDADQVQVKEAVSARIIEALQLQVVARRVEYFFLLFHGWRCAASSAPCGWQEPFLLRELGQREIPYVSSKRYLREHVQRTGAELSSSFFIAEMPGLNHYTPATNAIVFEALRAGLEGRFE